MLILLPPSETKSAAACGDPLDLDALSWPSLQPTRRDLLASVIDMCRESDADTRERYRTFFGLKATQDAELDRTAEILTSPTRPAIELYTGVAYDALDATGERTGTPLGDSARSRIAVCSALFGLVSADDRIPYYRLSASAKVLPTPQARSRLTGRAASADPAVPVTMRAMWGSRITRALEDWVATAPADANAVIDLRSGGYAALGKAPGAVSVRVETEYPDGSRKVVSHFNKHYRGLVARELALVDRELGTGTAGQGSGRPGAGVAEALCDVLQTRDSLTRSGFAAEVTDQATVTLVVPPAPTGGRG